MPFVCLEFLENVQRNVKDEVRAQEHHQHHHAGEHGVRNESVLYAASLGNGAVNQREGNKHSHRHEEHGKQTPDQAKEHIGDGDRDHGEGCVSGNVHSIQEGQVALHHLNHHEGHACQNNCVNHSKQKRQPECRPNLNRSACGLESVAVINARILGKSSHQCGDVHKLSENEHQDAYAGQDRAGPGGVLNGIGNDCLLTCAGEEAYDPLHQVAQDGRHTVQGCVLIGFGCSCTGGVTAACAEGRAFGKFFATLGTEHTVFPPKVYNLF